ncbi:MAG: hypothetical protein R3F19_11680 [Verrucomicrobiales bacterium]
MNSKRSCRPQKRTHIGARIAGVGFFVAQLPLSAQESEGTWTKLADMPTARHSHCTCVIDGKVYTVGGYGGLRKLEVYDPASDTWTKKADMATSRAWFGVGVVDGKIYAIGGSNVLRGARSRSVEEYDPDTDTWTKKRDMPIATYLHTACTVDGKIYVMGGYPGSSGVSTVYEFDPRADSWTEKANMLSVRGGFFADVVDEKIYAFGGINDGTSAISQVEMYDPEIDTWTRKASIPRGINPTVSVLNGSVYAFGGVPAKGGSGIRKIYRYNASADAWEDYGDMPINITGNSSVSLNSSIYVIGGCSGPYPYTSGILNKVWKFTPPPPVDPNDPDADGIPTDVELLHGLDPNVPDADSDYDGDGVKAIDEIANGTRANNPDSDGDGLGDGVETNSGTYASAEDTGTDPTTVDTDGDGQNDGAEIAGGSNPLDAESLYGDWPDLISLNITGFEPEGIELGRNHDFFVGAFSFSTWFGAPYSPQSGAIYKGNFRTGEGALLVQPTGTPIKGLSYDARTDYLWVAKGFDEGTQGVIVYDAASGEEIANITYEGERTNNDILVTDNYVYTTDSLSPVLYRIPLGADGELPASLVVEDLPMNGFIMHPEAGKTNANGLVETADGNLIVSNTATGVLFHVDSTSGDTVPVNVTGDETSFANGDGLYLDGNLLYICQNFSNKIATVQLTEDFKSGIFMWNLVSENLVVPTTITGDGDSIYAINTNFPLIAAGNHAESIPAVVKLPNVGVPSIWITGVAIEEGESVNISFVTPAPATIFEFTLEQAADLAGPWAELSNEALEAEGSRAFRVPYDPSQNQSFYRATLRRR